LFALFLTVTETSYHMAKRYVPTNGSSMEEAYTVLTVHPPSEYFWSKDGFIAILATVSSQNVSHGYQWVRLPVWKTSKPKSLSTPANGGGYL